MTEVAADIPHLSTHAARTPDKPALIMGGGEVLTYAELEARSCRVANLLRSVGCETGDHVAILLENQLEWFEIAWGALRAGLYVTPINWHLSAEEAAYIVEDCGASALFAAASLGSVVTTLGDAAPRACFAVGGAIEGFTPYEEAVAAQPSTPPADQSEGNWMFYSSGTTGRPKGVKPPVIGQPLGQGGTSGFVLLVSGLYGGGPDSVYLSPAPLYHAAPAGWTTSFHRLGATVVMMEKFDAADVLRLVEAHRVTHAQFVPTHLIRMLKLPEEQRHAADLSSLRYAIHAAAPCPPEVKRAALEWLGPVVYEYYSGSEGAGFCAIGPDEWLAHPGSVGRSLLGTAHVVGEDGEEVAVGDEGQIWFEGSQRFEYHGDPAKTAEAHDARGWTTLGDIGRIDEDGYLYLTDRVSNMIISGGANIYPREVEDVLVGHPAVADVAVVGVPDPDLGEVVRAVVQVDPDAPGAEPGDALAAELIAFTRDRIAHFKCPRSVLFLDDLPRLPTGKLVKRLLPPEALAP